MKTLSPLFLLIAVTFLSACTKSDAVKTTDTTTPGTSNVLLTKVFDNNSSSPTYGQTADEFTYNGKQLVKVVAYMSSTEFETDVFNYNAAGQLTGTIITTSNNGVVTPGGANGESSSTITNDANNNIVEIKYYDSKGVMDDDVKFTWQNGYIIKIAETASVAATKYTYSGTTTYQYDSNNHDIKNIYSATENYNGSISTTANTSTFSTFDTKMTVSQAIPYFLTYFFNTSSIGSYSVTNYGANNPSNFDDGDGYSETHSYQYNSSNFPSSEIITVFELDNNTKNIIDSENVGYQYIQVK